MLHAAFILLVNLVNLSSVFVMLVLWNFRIIVIKLYIDILEQFLRKVLQEVLLKLQASMDLTYVLKPDGWIIGSSA
jgi:hypothetical protein